MYDVLGNVIQEIDAKGYITKQEYNFRGQPTAIYKPDGSAEYFVYNDNGGTLATHIEPQGTQTHYSYDIFDRPIRTEVYSSEGELLKSTTSAYSTFNKLSETDGEGHTTYYKYDLAGRKIGEEIQKVQKEFDGNKNLIQETHFIFDGTTPIKTLVHNWIYGPCNRLEKLIESGQRETSYLYDNTGKLSHVIKPDKTELKSEYDPLSRLARFFSYDFDYSYTYDKNDEVLSVIDTITQATTTRVYDPLGNLTHEVLGNGLIIFAEHNPEIAESISRSLGYREIKEYQEVISYGAHEIRDGVSLSLQAKKIPGVSATDIQSLENNSAFIKLPGNLPISKVNLQIK